MRTGSCSAATLALSPPAGAQPEPRYPSPIELAMFSGRRAPLRGVRRHRRTGRGRRALRQRVAAHCGGPGAEGIALSPDGQRAYVANSWSDTVSEIDTASLRGGPHAAARASSRTRCSRTAGRVPLHGQPHQQRHFRDRPGQRAWRSSGWLAGAAPAIWRPRPTAAASTARTSTRTSGKFRTPPRIGDHGHRRRAPDGAWTATACTMPRAFSTWRFRATAGWASPPSCVPRTSSRWRTSSTAGSSAIRSRVFGADVGEPVQLPIDELERYYTTPFGVAIAPDKSAAYISTTGADSVTVIDIERLLEFVRALRPRERRALANDLSASAHYVAARIPVGRGPKGMALSPDGAGSTWPTATGRHGFGDRHRHAQSRAHDRARRAGANSPPSAAASVCSSTRGSPSRGISAAPTATWKPLSTACNGTWSRTASARTSWTTGCWKTSTAPSRSSGTAAIRTWKPNAARAPRSSSTARRVTRATNWSDLVATSSRCRCVPTATAWRMAS